MNTKRTRSQTAISLLCAVACTVATAAQAADKPNIVFILTDNLGYGEIGCYGGGLTRGAPTPRIDSLAKSGLRLLNMNMETQCTPSRASLMTGRWAIRSGTHSVPFAGSEVAQLEAALHAAGHDVRPAREEPRTDDFQPFHRSS